MNASRRTFLKSLGAAGAALCARPALAYEPIPPLKVHRHVVELGLARPFTVLHVSDSHLMAIDSRDDAARHALADRRSRIGRELGSYYLDEATAYARARGLRIVHTGDFMDFVTAANLENAERRFKTDPYLACVGNHEYRCGPTNEQESEKLPVLPQLRAAYPDGLPASVREIGGVRFFVFDDAFCNVSEEVVAAFDRVAAEGRPLVLVCHVPLFAIRTASAYWMKNGIRGREVLPRTWDFVNRVAAAPCVKAVLCGHLHVHSQVRLSDACTEYVTGALFDGVAQEIAFR